MKHVEILTKTGRRKKVNKYWHPLNLNHAHLCSHITTFPIREIYICLIQKCEMQKFSIIPNVGVRWTFESISRRNKSCKAQNEIQRRERDPLLKWTTTTDQDIQLRRYFSGLTLVSSFTKISKIFRNVRIHNE